MPTLQDFDYTLPKASIAQQPASPRDSSRLLVYQRTTGKISHHHFYDLPSLLTDRDVIVRNNTKVIPARLFGKKATGGIVEVLLIRHIATKPDREYWETLVKPGITPGISLQFGHGRLEGICTKVLGYTRIFCFNKTGTHFYEAIGQCGYTPLPPYIHQEKDKEDTVRKEYQTIYAKYQGSAAAPTAGLHFTNAVDKALLAKGVKIEEITLHVGLGTFLPVKTNDIEKHEMHSEWFSLSPDVAKRLNQDKKEGKRIIAVGTTSVRVLESSTDDNEKILPAEGETSIYIHPPYKFHFVEGLVTNFHTPKSTLLMLISAFCTTPNAKEEFKNFKSSGIGKAYLEALQQDYRFFSFGDAMLIL